jgi:transposase
VKTYRAYDPEQPYLLPPSPRDWLGDDHLAIFVLDLVRELDLRAIDAQLQAKEARGERPYSPVMMTALLVYAYSVGVFSSRRIERATVEDVAFRYLCGGQHPHFTTINQFRGKYRQQLAGLFEQVLKACMSAGLVKLEHVAIDGTKMKANASKHKAMSYDRMLKDDERIRNEVEELLVKAEAADAADDATEGAYDPQEEVRRRQERLAKMAAAREALRAETKAARAARLQEQAEELRAKAADPTTAPRDQKGFVTLAAKRDEKANVLLAEAGKPSPHDDDDDDNHDDDGDDLPRNTPPSTADGEPKPKAQRNFTDPQSRIMFRDGAAMQGYNAQAAVDDTSQVIVAAAVSNQAPDTQYFAPMLRRVIANCEAVPAKTTADSGYFSAANVLFAENVGTEPFISVGKHRNDGTQVEPTSRPHDRTPAKQAMRAILETPEGRATYALRKSTVEPVFGQIRSCRGFRQFSFRGLLKNQCEWAFVCLTHNILKLFRAQRLVLAA